ncbi:MAG TPA: SPOR domain-containing protein, partial [bacterium]|nr:SPOR domain-containing protein [bacterium]
MGEQKKKLVLMGVLLVVLIISWTVVLSPKKKSGKAVPGKLPENITSQAAAPPLQNNFNLSEVERTMKEARAALTAVEETETGGKGADWGKNPFSPWGPPARSVSPVMTHSILKETRPGLPTFTLSGIIYDRARPLAIINEQVCTESERLEGYQVYRIYPDRVVLKSSEHTLVLKITSSGGTELVEEKVLAEQKEKEKTSEVSAVGVSEVKEKNFLSGKKEERQVKSGSGATFKTVQVLSVPEENISQAKEEGKKLANQGFDRVRLLKDDDFVVLRVGAYQRMSEAKEVWAKLR